MPGVQNIEGQEQRLERQKRLTKLRQKQEQLKLRLASLRKQKDLSTKEEEIQQYTDQIQNKQNYVYEIIKQLASQKRLMQRNKEVKKMKQVIVQEHHKFRQSFIVARFKPNSKIEH